MPNVQQLALSGLVLPETAPVPELELEARRRCVIYVRVSTIAQEDGFSPEIQRQHGLALAARETFAVAERRTAGPAARDPAHGDRPRGPRHYLRA
jgi:hypothetical protein